MTISKRWIAALAVVCAFRAGASAQDTTYRWEGNGDGTSWDDEDNWDVGSGCPDDPSDYASFDSNVEVVLDLSVMVGGIHVEGCDVVLIGLSEELGPVWQDVIILDPDGIDIDAGGSLTIGEDLRIKLLSNASGFHDVDGDLVLATDTSVLFIGSDRLSPGSGNPWVPPRAGFSARIQTRRS